MHILFEVFILSHVRYLLLQKNICFIIKNKYLFVWSTVCTNIYVNEYTWLAFNSTFRAAMKWYILSQKFDIYLRGFLSSEDVS